MISICCVDFASLDVVCDQLDDCACYLGRQQLSDKGVYVYCVESFAQIECYSDCSRRGSHLLNHFATVLCFVPVLVWCVCCYVRKKAFLQCAIIERRDMGLYEVPLSMSLLYFGMGTMLANFHMCGIMLVSRGPMCFRRLMFNLSGPCELLLFTLFYCLLDLSCSECYVISLYLMCCSVNGSVCLVCCVFVKTW